MSADFTGAFDGNWGFFSLSINKFAPLVISLLCILLKGLPGGASYPLELLYVDQRPPQD